MQIKTNIKLGNEYKDHVTGFKGIATAYIFYITGCRHVELTPKGLDKDGRPKASQWFDESRVDPASEIMKGNLAGYLFGAPGGSHPHAEPPTIRP